MVSHSNSPTLISLKSELVASRQAAEFEVFHFVGNELFYLVMGGDSQLPIAALRGEGQRHLRRSSPSSWSRPISNFQTSSRRAVADRF